MATITKEQVTKINNGCKNNFKFDIFHFASWSGEKQLIKNIEINDKNVLVATLMFHDVYENHMAIKCNVPTIHYAMYTKNEGTSFMTSSGIGYFNNIGKPLKRKSVKVLQDMTSVYTDAKCIDEYNTLSKTKKNYFE